MGRYLGSKASLTFVKDVELITKQGSGEGTSNLWGFVKCCQPMLLLLTERNLSFKTDLFFSDKEKVHLSAKRMILGASDRSVVAGTQLCSGCRTLLAG